MSLVKNYLSEIQKDHREASYVYVIKNGNLLLAEESYDRYILPGGGTHSNELPEESAKRETLEEIAVVITNLKKVGEFTFNFNKKGEMYSKWGHGSQTSTVFVADFVEFNKELYGDGPEGILKIKEMTRKEYEDYLIRRIEEVKDEESDNMVYYTNSLKFLKLI